MTFVVCSTSTRHLADGKLMGTVWMWIQSWCQDVFVSICHWEEISSRREKRHVSAAEKSDKNATESLQCNQANNLLDQFWTGKPHAPKEINLSVRICLWKSGFWIFKRYASITSLRQARCIHAGWVIRSPEDTAPFHVINFLSCASWSCQTRYRWFIIIGLSIRFDSIRSFRVVRRMLQFMFLYS